MRQRHWQPIDFWRCFGFEVRSEPLYQNRANFKITTPDLVACAGSFPVKSLSPPATDSTGVAADAHFFRLPCRIGLVLFVLWVFAMPSKNKDE